MCLHSRSSINIRNHSIIRMFSHKLAKLISITTICQRTTSCQIRHQHLLLRRKNLSSFTHKMHTANHQNISIRFLSPLRQSKTIPHNISHILYFTHLIIMRKNHSIFLFTQTVNFRNQLFLFHSIHFLKKNSTIPQPATHTFNVQRYYFILT